MQKKCPSTAVLRFPIFSFPFSSVAAEYLFAQLQEPHHLQRLLDIWNLLAQPLPAALGVHLHELVLGDHLLERAEGRLDLGAGGDVVADIVDEGRYGDPVRVCLCCDRAVMEGLVVRHYRIVGVACSEWEELDTGDCPSSGRGK